MADTPTPLRHHLAELRRRLLISSVALVAGLVTAFVFRQHIFDVLTRPIGDRQLYVYTLTGSIGPAMKVALLGGVIVALPVFVYQIVGFIAPALSAGERRFFNRLIPGVALAFCGGVAFAYFVLLPPIVVFLLGFGAEVAIIQPSLESYINTVTALMFWMGVAFETPFVMYLLSAIGITSPEKYSRFRRPWIVVSVILGALITPTFDPVNQAMVAAPFLVLYEIGILLSRFGRRGARKRSAAGL